ncbi:MAG TPA: VCBS repeat-containing protein, partial [Thermoanaerobaculia bacterium]
TPGNISFAPASVLTVGRRGHCNSCTTETDLQAADLRRNGLQDLVASFAVNSSVYVLLNDGKKAGTFKPPVEYPVGPNPLWVRIGDFDGDGIPDIATVNLERKPTIADVWSISFLKGHQDPVTKLPDGTFLLPAKTLTLPDDQRLGRTDNNNVSPYEMHSTEVVVTQVAGSKGRDVLVIASADFGLPLAYWIDPSGSGSGKFSVFTTVALSLPPINFNLTGTAPFAFLGEPMIGPGTLAIGQPRGLPFFFNWMTLDPPNSQFSRFLPDNLGTLGRLEGFRIEDFDGDGQADILALFSRLAMVALGGAGAPHPFTPLVGGPGGKVKSFPLFTRAVSDLPLFHSAAVKDFDGDGTLDLLAGSDDESKLNQLEIYLGTKSDQGGPLTLVQFGARPLREGETATIMGTGFRPGSPAPLRSAILREVGGSSTWVVPVTASAVKSDTAWDFQVPTLGDSVFWKAHGGSINLQVTAQNACFDSNVITLTVIHL